MKLQRSLNIFLRAMFIGIFFGTFCIHKSFGRPTKLENFSPPGPSDLRIAFADPIVEGRSNAQGPKFEGKKKVPRAARYLLNFGYLESKDFNDENVTENQIESAIKNFQHFAHLPLTGRLDDATVNQMEKPRCGMKDPRIKFKVNGKGRQKRYTLQGEKWDFSTRSTRTLTWYLVNTYGSMTRDDIRRIIHYALGKWQAAANINFKEVQTNSADILVSFAPGQHGDPYPFDGRGGTLAHAYYPYKNFALGGDIHFDADEYFTFQKKEGTNLLWVAVHEAGHSLGLEHSDLLDAVMYPWYRGSEASDFDLRPDDISGIQALYGPRPQPPTTAEPTTQPTTKPTTQPTTKPTTQPTTKPTTQPTTKPTTQPTTKPTTQPTTKPTTQPTTKPTTQPTTKSTSQATTPDTQGPTRPPGMKDCMEYVDAAVIDFSSGWMYLFSGENFYLVSRRGLRYGPITFKTYFREVEGKVTAAYMRQNDFALILFSGSRYYVYQRFSLIKEGPVADFGLPADATVDAALQWQGSSRTPWTAGTKTYLFTGTKYYRYDEITKRIDSYYPRVVSSAWRGLPSQVTAAVTGFEVEGNRKETYFINGKYYYIFDDEFIKVKPGYPKHIKDWLKCYSTDSAPFGAIGSLFALDDPEDDPQKAP